MHGVLLGLTIAFVLAAALRSRGPSAREFFSDAPIVFLAALLTEESATALFRLHADYAPGFAIFLGRTPLLSTLGWIFIVLTARDLGRLLTPSRMLAGATLVLFLDGLLAEPIGVATGLWHWTRRGLFDVPLVGFIVWPLFGASVLLCLERLQGRARWLTVVAAPLLANLGFATLGAGVVIASGKAVLEESLGAAVAVALAIGLIALALVCRVTIPLWAMAAPLVLVAGMFLLLGQERFDRDLWIWSLALVTPFAVALRPRWS